MEQIERSVLYHPFGAAAALKLHQSQQKRYDVSMSKSLLWQYQVHLRRHHLHSLKKNKKTWILIIEGIIVAFHELKSIAQLLWQLEKKIVLNAPTWLPCSHYFSHTYTHSTTHKYTEFWFRKRLLISFIVFTTWTIISQCTTYCQFFFIDMNVLNKSVM